METCLRVGHWMRRTGEGEPTIELGHVIPPPAEVRPDRPADVTVPPGTAVRTTAATAAAAAELATAIRAATGYAIPVSETAGSIALLLGKGAAESYTLDIGPTEVAIEAGDPDGAFAAVHT